MSTTKISGVTNGILDLGTRRSFAVFLPGGIHVRQAKGPPLTIPAPKSPVSFVLFDQSAERLAVAAEDGTVSVWNLPTGTRLEEIRPVALEKGSSVAAGIGFGVLYLLGPEKIRLLSLDPDGVDTTLEFARDPAVMVSLSRDGRALASMNPDAAIEIRILPAGTVQAKLSGFEARPTSIALSPDGSILAVDVDGKAVDLWDTAKGERVDGFESNLWLEGGITFSPDGYFLAWVEENRKNVRFWSPVRGVVKWESGRPTLAEKARPVCPDLASIIRYRRATESFERGMRHLGANELREAKGAFASAQEVFPSYPGLAVAAAEAEERLRANARTEQVLAQLEKFEANGEYYKALSLLEEFSRDFPAYSNVYRERMKQVRTMLQHFEVAEARREAGSDLEAVKEFEKAVAVYPDLLQKHPEYSELRKRLLSQLETEAGTVFDEHNYKRLLEIYADLVQLRPLGTQAWLRRGEANESLGYPKRAEEAYESIADKAPEYAEARWRLARLARSNGKLGRAKAQLERARNAAPRNIPLATDYAEVCELLKDFDDAIAAWNRVGELQPGNPKPFEIIGGIEERRERWAEAGEAYRKCVRRSDQPRPHVLLKLADVYGRTGAKEQVLEAYVDLFEIAQGEVHVPLLGKNPKQKVLKWIRDLGYVRHRGKWIPKEQFYAEQGWVQYSGDTWVRPEEARLREIARRFEKQNHQNLRALADARYKAEAEAKRISKGMNRREVIQAWGFFEDQNIFKLNDGIIVYEQLLFSSGRQVYLRNGLVCFWSE